MKTFGDRVGSTLRIYITNSQAQCRLRETLCALRTTHDNVRLINFLVVFHSEYQILLNSVKHITNVYRLLIVVTLIKCSFSENAKNVIDHLLLTLH